MSGLTSLSGDDYPWSVRRFVIRRVIVTCVRVRHHQWGDEYCVKVTRFTQVSHFHPSKASQEQGPGRLRGEAFDKSAEAFADLSSDMVPVVCAVAGSWET